MNRQKYRERSGPAQCAGMSSRADRGARATRECGLLITRFGSARRRGRAAARSARRALLRAHRASLSRLERLHLCASAEAVPYDRTLIYSRRLLMTALAMRAHSSMFAKAIKIPPNYYFRIPESFPLRVMPASWQQCITMDCARIVTNSPNCVGPRQRATIRQNSGYRRMCTQFTAFGTNWDIS